MENLKSSAHPHLTYGLYGEGPEISYTEVDKNNPGFTKLELASLMIAQGYISAAAFKEDEQEGYEIARCSVNVAKLVLQEANK